LPAEPDRPLDRPDEPGAPGGALVRVRPAGPHDAELLLAWANDPLTRAAGFHPRPIEPEEHRAWLAERLASSSSRLLIGLADGQPFGQIRLERAEDGVAEVSIAIAPEARGRGLGRQLLDTGLAAALADRSFAVSAFVARIRPGNVASIRLFGGAGFDEAERTLVDGEACTVLRRG
jgi:RimJ/RimL family protein N-acetyltransferase